MPLCIDFVHVEAGNSLTGASIQGIKHMVFTPEGDKYWYDLLIQFCPIEDGEM